MKDDEELVFEEVSSSGELFEAVPEPETPRFFFDREFTEGASRYWRKICYKRCKSYGLSVGDRTCSVCGEPLYTRCLSPWEVPEDQQFWEALRARTTRELEREPWLRKLLDPTPNSTDKRKPVLFERFCVLTKRATVSKRAFAELGMREFWERAMVTLHHVPEWYMVLHKDEFSVALAPLELTPRRLL